MRAVQFAGKNVVVLLSLDGNVDLMDELRHHQEVIIFLNVTLFCLQNFLT